METPQIKVLKLGYRNRPYWLEYFIRPGKGDTILFVHGLGGCKENFWDAVKSHHLKNYTLISFDNPGTGNSSYYEDQILTVDDLAILTSMFVDTLGLRDFVLSGASMGGLITLLYLQQFPNKAKAYINIEGNLTYEDCMFSAKVVRYEPEYFQKVEFTKVIREMKNHGNPGYHIIANNLELNTNIISYYHYCALTVNYSSSGRLLKNFLNLPTPRLFIYGDKNCHLSYLSALKGEGLEVAMISNSDHFLFYDNPKEMYAIIDAFIARLALSQPD